MACRIRVQPIEGAPGAVGLVCEMLDHDAEVGGAAATDSVRVDAVLLADFVRTLDEAIETLVFLTADDAAAETDMAAHIARMTERLKAEPDHVAAIRRVPAVNATKRVSDGVIVEAVDRATLNLLRSPEVVRRAALEAALGRLNPMPDDPPISPTVAAASDGDPVLVVDDDSARP